MAAFVLPFCILEFSLNRPKAIFHLKQVFLLLINAEILSLPKLFLQFGHFELQFFDLVALQVDKFEHLEVLFLIFAEDSQELIEVINFCGSLDLSKVLSEFLYLFHLLGTLLSLPV